MPEKTTELSNEVMVAVVLGTLLLVMLAVWVITFLVLYRRRQEQFKREKELLLTQFEQEMQLARLEVQEQTQRQIASEIHDNVGQLLSVVRLYQSGLAAEITNEAQHKRINEANALTGQAIADLRSLSHSLNSDQLALHSLAESLRAEADRITRSGVFSVEFSVSGSTFMLPPDTTLMLYRMVQELLQNAIRHSGGNVIVVTVDRLGQQLQITVADNGRGIDEQQDKGSGTTNLLRRAQLIGATIEYTAASSGGTSARINFPLP